MGLLTRVTLELGRPGGSLGAGRQSFPTLTRSANTLFVPADVAGRSPRPRGEWGVFPRCFPPIRGPLLASRVLPSPPPFSGRTPRTWDGRRARCTLTEPAKRRPRARGSPRRGGGLRPGRHRGPAGPALVQRPPSLLTGVTHSWQLAALDATWKMRRRVAESARTTAKPPGRQGPPK